MSVFGRANQLSHQLAPGGRSQVKQLQVEVVRLTGLHVVTFCFTAKQFWRLKLNLGNKSDAQRRELEINTGN